MKKHRTDEGLECKSLYRRATVLGTRGAKWLVHAIYQQLPGAGLHKWRKRNKGRRAGVLKRSTRSGTPEHPKTRSQRYSANYEATCWNLNTYGCLENDILFWLKVWKWLSTCFKIWIEFYTELLHINFCVKSLNKSIDFLYLSSKASISIICSA